MKRSRSLLAISLLVVPLCLLGFSVAKGFDPTTLEVDDDTPELGTVLNLEVTTDAMLTGQKCLTLLGTTPGPTWGIPVGGMVKTIGVKTITGPNTDFQMFIPNNPGLDGVVVYFASITVNAFGSITSISNGIDVKIIDQEDIPG